MQKWIVMTEQYCIYSFLLVIDFFGFYFAGDFNARLSQKFFPLTRLFYDKSFFSQN